MKLATLRRDLTRNVTRHVLIVDDEESICWGLERLLTEEGHCVSVASSAEEALEAVARDVPHLVVMDVRLPGMDGITAIERLHAVAGPVPVVVITAFGSLDVAVSAMKRGAIDYLTKPFDLDQAAGVIRRALEHADATCVPAPDDTPEVGTLLGTCPAMQLVFKQIALVAPSDASVLIVGESGTGKELAARAIHRHSSRADRPFVPINLASLSPTLVESELFGHRRGAFTGAETDRSGLLELADGGTIFFDETGDIPLNVQVKLLRVLEQREVTPVGDTRARRTDFRVIAATNREVRKSLIDGSFRRDLYFRLAGFEIMLPPLRERVADIPLLAAHFLRGDLGAGAAGITDEALAELCRRAWPGNVRELRNAIEHGALLARGGPIGPEHLPAPREMDQPPAGDLTATLRYTVQQWAAARLAANDARGMLYDNFLTEVESPLFEIVLKHTTQNRAAAAELLGIHRATLRKKLN